MISAYAITALQDGSKTKMVRFGDRDAILRVLEKQGFTILKIRQTKAEGARSISKSDTHYILESIGDMLELEPNATKCLQTFAETMEDDEKFKHILFDIVHNIRTKGLLLSEAFDLHVQNFGSVVINLLRAAEVAGNYGRAFQQAAEFIKKTIEIMQKFKRMMIYPSLLLTFGIVGMVITVTWSVPTILDSMASQNPEVNQYWTVRVLNGIAAGIIPFFGSVALLIAMVLFYFKINQERAESLLIKIPLVKEIIFYRGFALAFYSASRLLEATKLSDTLEQISKTADYIVIRNDFARALKCLKRGEDFVYGLEHLDRTERYVLLNTRSSEKMSRFMDKIHERFFKKYERKMNALSVSLAMVVMALLFSIVLLVAASIIVPMGTAMRGLVEHL